MIFPAILLEFQDVTVKKWHRKLTWEWKGKQKREKFSLCLIHSAPRYEDVWGSGAIAPALLTSALDGGE
jgi:hypothetical protein